jgi:hypothetical protein
MASRRCRPLGVQKLAFGVTIAMTGSRNRRVLLMTSARRLWWVSERWRWKGVGSIASMGRNREQYWVPGKRIFIEADDAAAGFFHGLCGLGRSALQAPVADTLLGPGPSY